MLKFLFLFAFISICLNQSQFAAEASNITAAIADDSPGFITIGEGRYFIDTSKLRTWYDAAHFCRLLNADLVSIETAEEMSALAEFLNVNFGGNSFWTSGNELIGSGDWRWLGSGLKADYLLWGAGEPNGFFNAEHCIEIKVINNEYRLNDLHCLGYLQVICEQ